MQPRSFIFLSYLEAILEGQIKFFNFNRSTYLSRWEYMWCIVGNLLQCPCKCHILFHWLHDMSFHWCNSHSLLYSLILLQTSDPNTLQSDTVEWIVVYGNIRASQILYMIVLSAGSIGIPQIRVSAITWNSSKTLVDFPSVGRDLADHFVGSVTIRSRLNRYMTHWIKRQLSRNKYGIRSRLTREWWRVLPIIIRQFVHLWADPRSCLWSGCCTMSDNHLCRLFSFQCQLFYILKNGHGNPLVMIY